MRRLLRRGVMLALALVAASLVACKGQKKDEKDPKDLPVPVQVMEVRPSAIARQLHYDADIEGDLEVKVFAQVAERIVSLPVEEGDQVKKRQLLAVLRSDALSGGVRSTLAAVDAARAERNSIRSDLQRAEKLAQRKIVAEAQVDQLRARLLATEAQMRRLEAVASQAATAKSHAYVRSPLDGVVGRRFLQQGDMAAPTLPILTVVRMDRVKLTVEVSEQDLAHLKTGMTAFLTVRRYPGRRFEGRVTLIAPMIDRRTRTARVKVELDNPGHLLMPGMLARVSFQVESRDHVPVVPYSALVIESDNLGKVTYRGFILNGEVARERTFTLGLIDGDRVEITKGLAFGERLVTQGQNLLDNGRRVKVVETLQGTAVTPATSPAATAPAAP